jgi:hypothetical protein
MNPLQWFITLSGIAADTLTTLGQPSIAGVFRSLGKLAQSGGDVEAHMAQVRAKLDAGITKEDWQQVHDGIISEQDKINQA